MLKWRIYYSDGSTFDDTQGTPEQAPSLGIVIINQSGHDGGPLSLAGFDYYWHENDWWYGGDLFGFWDYLQRTGIGKFGRVMFTPDYRALRDKAEKDPDFVVPGCSCVTWKRE